MAKKCSTRHQATSKFVMSIAENEAASAYLSSKIRELNNLKSAWKKNFSEITKVKAEIENFVLDASVQNPLYRDQVLKSIGDFALEENHGDINKTREIIWFLDNFSYSEGNINEWFLKIMWVESPETFAVNVDRINGMLEKKLIYDYVYEQNYGYDALLRRLADDTYKPSEFVEKTEAQQDAYINSMSADIAKREGVNTVNYLKDKMWIDLYPLLEKKRSKIVSQYLYLNKLLNPKADVDDTLKTLKKIAVDGVSESPVFFNKKTADELKNEFTKSLPYTLSLDDAGRTDVLTDYFNNLQRVKLGWGADAITEYAQMVDYLNLTIKETDDISSYADSTFYKYRLLRYGINTDPQGARQVVGDMNSVLKKYINGEGDGIYKFKSGTNKKWQPTYKTINFSKDWISKYFSIVWEDWFDPEDVIKLSSIMGSETRAKSYLESLRAGVLKDEIQKWGDINTIIKNTEAYSSELNSRLTADIKDIIERGKDTPVGDSVSRFLTDNPISNGDNIVYVNYDANFKTTKGALFWAQYKSHSLDTSLKSKEFKGPSDDDFIDSVANDIISSDKWDLPLKIVVNTSSYDNWSKLVAAINVKYAEDAKYKSREPAILVTPEKGKEKYGFFVKWGVLRIGSPSSSNINDLYKNFSDYGSNLNTDLPVDTMDQYVRFMEGQYGTDYERAILEQERISKEMGQPSPRENLAVNNNIQKQITHFDKWMSFEIADLWAERQDIQVKPLQFFSDIAKKETDLPIEEINESEVDDMRNAYFQYAFSPSVEAKYNAKVKFLEYYGVRPIEENFDEIARMNYATIEVARTTDTKEWLKLPSNLSPLWIFRGLDDENTKKYIERVVINNERRFVNGWEIKKIKVNGKKSTKFVITPEADREVRALFTKAFEDARPITPIEETAKEWMSFVYKNTNNKEIIDSLKKEIAFDLTRNKSKPDAYKSIVRTKVDGYISKARAIIDWRWDNLSKSKKMQELNREMYTTIDTIDNDLKEKFRVGNIKDKDGTVVFRWVFTPEEQLRKLQDFSENVRNGDDLIINSIIKNAEEIYDNYDKWLTSMGRDLDKLNKAIKIPTWETDRFNYFISDGKVLESAGGIPTVTTIDDEIRRLMDNIPEWVSDEIDIARKWDISALPIWTKKDLLKATYATNFVHKNLGSTNVLDFIYKRMYPDLDYFFDKYKVVDSDVQNVPVQLPQIMRDTIHTKNSLEIDRQAKVDIFNEISKAVKKEPLTTDRLLDIINDVVEKSNMNEPELSKQAFNYIFEPYTRVGRLEVDSEILWRVAEQLDRSDTLIKSFQSDLQWITVNVGWKQIDLWSYVRGESGIASEYFSTGNRGIVSETVPTQIQMNAISQDLDNREAGIRQMSKVEEAVKWAEGMYSMTLKNALWQYAFGRRWIAVSWTTRSITDWLAESVSLLNEKYDISNILSKYDSYRAQYAWLNEFPPLPNGVTSTAELDLDSKIARQLYTYFRDTAKNYKWIVKDPVMQEAIRNIQNSIGAVRNVKELKALGIQAGNMNIVGVAMMGMDKKTMRLYRWWTEKWVYSEWLLNTLEGFRSIFDDKISDFDYRIILHGMVENVKINDLLNARNPFSSWRNGIGALGRYTGNIAEAGKFVGAFNPYQGINFFNQMLQYPVMIATEIKNIGMRQYSFDGIREFMDLNNILTDTWLDIEKLTWVKWISKTIADVVDASQGSSITEKISNMRTTLESKINIPQGKWNQLKLAFNEFKNSAGNYADMIYRPQLRTTAFMYAMKNNGIRSFYELEDLTKFINENTNRRYVQDVMDNIKRVTSEKYDEMQFVQWANLGKWITSGHSRWVLSGAISYWGLWRNIWVFFGGMANAALNYKWSRWMAGINLWKKNVLGLYGWLKYALTTEWWFKEAYDYFRTTPEYDAFINKLWTELYIGKAINRVRNDGNQDNETDFLDLADSAGQLWVLFAAIPASYQWRVAMAWLKWWIDDGDATLGISDAVFQLWSETLRQVKPLFKIYDALKAGDGDPFKTLWYFRDNMDRWMKYIMDQQDDYAAKNRPFYMTQFNLIAGDNLNSDNKEANLVRRIKNRDDFFAMFDTEKEVKQDFLWDDFMTDSNEKVSAVIANIFPVFKSLWGIFSDAIATATGDPFRFANKGDFEAFSSFMSNDDVMQKTYRDGIFDISMIQDPAIRNKMYTEISNSVFRKDSMFNGKQYETIQWYIDSTTLDNEFLANYLRWLGIEDNAGAQKLVDELMKIPQNKMKTAEAELLAKSVLNDKAVGVSSILMNLGAQKEKAAILAKLKEAGYKQTELPPDIIQQIERGIVDNIMPALYVVNKPQVNAWMTMYSVMSNPQLADMMEVQERTDSSWVPYNKFKLNSSLANFTRKTLQTQEGIYNNEYNPDLINNKLSDALKSLPTSQQPAIFKLISNYIDASDIHSPLEKTSMKAAILEKHPELVLDIDRFWLDTDLRNTIVSDVYWTLKDVYWLGEAAWFIDRVTKEWETTNSAHLWKYKKWDWTKHEDLFTAAKNTINQRPDIYKTTPYIPSFSTQLNYAANKEAGRIANDMMIKYDIAKSTPDIKDIYNTKAKSSIGTIKNPKVKKYVFKPKKKKTWTKK